MRLRILQRWSLSHFVDFRYRPLPVWTVWSRGRNKTGSRLAFKLDDYGGYIASTWNSEEDFAGDGIEVGEVGMGFVEDDLNEHVANLTFRMRLGEL